jgi:hypothetical protein
VHLHFNFDVLFNCKLLVINNIVDNFQLLRYFLFYVQYNSRKNDNFVCLSKIYKVFDNNVIMLREAH